eukprot:tig00020951_g16469.t1
MKNAAGVREAELAIGSEAQRAEQLTVGHVIQRGLHLGLLAYEDRLAGLRVMSSAILRKNIFEASLHHASKAHSSPDHDAVLLRAAESSVGVAAFSPALGTSIYFGLMKLAERIMKPETRCTTRSTVVQGALFSAYFLSLPALQHAATCLMALRDEPASSAARAAFADASPGSKLPEAARRLSDRVAAEIAARASKA